MLADSLSVGRDSSASLWLLRAGRSGDRIPWGRDFPHPSTKALGPTQSPMQWVPSLFTEVKLPGRGVDYPLLSSAEVKE